MVKAVLVRHPRLAGEVAGMCYGRKDIACTETWRDEAEQLRSRLPWQPRELWTSPATRCHAMANYLAAESPVRIDLRLQELNFGDWEGQRWQDFRGPTSEAWALDPWNLSPPAGETGMQLWTRVAEIREEVRQLPSDSRLLIVTHAGVIRVWQALAANREAGAAVFDLAVGFDQVWPAD